MPLPFSLLVLFGVILMQTEWRNMGQSNDASFHSNRQRLDETTNDERRTAGDAHSQSTPLSKFGPWNAKMSIQVHLRFWWCERSLHRKRPICGLAGTVPLHRLAVVFDVDCIKIQNKSAGSHLMLSLVSWVFHCLALAGLWEQLIHISLASKGNGVAPHVHPSSFLPTHVVEFWK